MPDLAGRRQSARGARPTAERAATGLLVAAVFAREGINAFYNGVQRELPEALPILSSLFLWLSVVAWFALYSQRHHVSWPLDMGWFLFGFWIFVIPYYILKREGRAGLARLGLFSLTWFAAWATGWAILLWIRVLNGSD